MPAEMYVSFVHVLWFYHQWYVENVRGKVSVVALLWGFRYQLVLCKSVRVQSSSNTVTKYCGINHLNESLLTGLFIELSGFSAVWIPPVPVGECHHDVERRQEQHEVEERVGVGDSILFIVHSPVETAALLKRVCLRPVLDKSRLIAGQSQLVHLSVGRITNADGQTNCAVKCLLKQQLWHQRNDHQAARSEFNCLQTWTTPTKITERTPSPGVEDTHKEKD